MMWNSFFNNSLCVLLLPQFYRLEKLLKSEFHRKLKYKISDLSLHFISINFHLSIHSLTTEKELFNVILRDILWNYYFSFYDNFSCFQEGGLMGLELCTKSVSHATERKIVRDVLGDASGRCKEKTLTIYLWKLTNFSTLKVSLSCCAVPMWGVREWDISWELHNSTMHYYKRLFAQFAFASSMWIFFPHLNLSSYE